MIHYLFVGLAAALFSVGLMLLKGPFFNMALASTAMVNALIDPVSDEDTKQGLVAKRLGRLILWLLLFQLGLITITALAMSVLWIYIEYSNQTPESLDTASALFYISMVIGGVIPFLLYRPKSTSDYSDMSKLLHRMVLDNQHLSRLLFGLEKKLFLKSDSTDQPFLVVTGLARSGTTALTQLLYKTDGFHSLSYANMPFLLAPNLWKKVYNPKNAALKERAHGDSVKFGYDTVEALEEYFFKVMTNDAFVADKNLLPHELKSEALEAYRDYRRLIGKPSSTTYLAKNNNLILRLESLLEQEPNMKVVLMIRNPLEHANSLLQQHLRFSELQTADPFVLEYMNWLGHHEFGLNHKPFQLGAHSESNYQLTDINYWLSGWIAYYSFIKPYTESNRILLVEHSQLAAEPQTVLERIGSFLGEKLQLDKLIPHPQKTLELSADPFLTANAMQLYQELTEAKKN